MSVTVTDTGAHATVAQHNVFVQASSASSFAVYAGYYDTHHTHNLKAKPVPWQGSPNTVFVGQADSVTGKWDTSAVRVDNNSGATLTLTVTVTIRAKTYSLWGAQTIASGQGLVLAQMGIDTFDGSDTSTAGCYGCDPTLCTTAVSPTIPIVNITTGSVTTHYFDRQQILNTGGVDRAGRPYTGTRNDESEPWAPIPGPG